MANTEFTSGSERNNQAHDVPTETRPPGQRITADMSVNDVTIKYPQTIKVFFRHGMQCVGCYICRFHNIAESSKQYGVELESLLNDLNEAVAKKDP